MGDKRQRPTVDCCKSRLPEQESAPIPDKSCRCALQRVKKVFFGTLADGQESAKDKQTQAVGVQRYGRLAFVMEVKIP